MKRLLCILLSLALLLSLAACGSEDDPKKDDPKKDDPKETLQTDPILDEEDFVGFWAMTDGYVEVRQDGGFHVTDREGYLIYTGTWSIDDGLLLTFSDGSAAWFTLEENGNLYGGEDYGTLTPVSEPEYPTEGPNGFIDEAYADHWYLFGDLGFHSLVILYDGAWDIRDPLDQENNGGYTISEGYSTMDANGDLMLFDLLDNPVGNATLHEDRLVLVLFDDYAYLLEAYLPGDLAFEREANSRYYEQQAMGHDPEDYYGYWQYEYGYILQVDADGWYFYDENGQLLGWGPVDFDEEAAYLMNADGSSGGGILTFDEAGSLYETGNLLTWLAEFPFGNSEGEPNAQLLGEWLYTGHEHILYFDGVDAFAWQYGEEVITGTYSFDGTELTLYVDGEPAEWATMSAEGYLYLLGDSENYFYRNETP